MDQKRFALWAAVSSLPQVEKVSLDSQIELGRQAAAKHGGEIVAELIVPGESRDITLFQDACTEIAAYAKLHELIQAKAFDVFVYLNHSRLGRDAALSMTVLSLCRRAGIILYDLESPPANLDKPTRTHADLLISAIKSVGAEQEIIELTRRNAMGMLARVKRGEFPHQPPWGWVVRWTSDNGDAPRMAVEIDPQAAAAIRLIVDEYLHHGTGNEAIAEKLTTTGYPAPKGGAWWKSTVQFIVQRAWRYAGYTEINKRSKVGRPYLRAQSRWPAIITEADAEALHAEQKRRVSARRSVGSPHRFSQCVWCAECNRRMVGERNASFYLDRRYEKECYFCRGDHAWRQVSSKKVEAAVRAAVAFAQEPENRALVLTDDDPTTGHLEAQIADCEARLAQLRAARHRADDAYVDGRLDDDGHKRQVERLKRQGEAVQVEIQGLQEQIIQERRRANRGERLAEFAAQGAAMLATDDLATAATWFRARIRIWVNAGEVVEVEHI